MRLLFLFALGLATLLLTAGVSAAEIVTRQDRDGRTITFDVRATNVNVDWYANLLRDAAHGNEISRVTIRIVPRGEVDEFCGRGASGCYGGARGNARIVVPAGQSRTTAAILIHEYGHHVDRWISVSGAREPNGTPAWWRARDVAQLLEDGKVARNYSLGWGRSIGEIFAEDYTVLHLGTRWRIRAVAPPSTAVLDALRADLENAPATPSSSARLTPLVVKRSGTLGPGERRTLPFGLLGPGRRVTYTAEVGSIRTAGARARMELVCGQTEYRKAVKSGRSSARIRKTDLGPADCEIALVNRTKSPLAYTVTLRLKAPN